MKLALALLALTAVASARNINLEDVIDLEDNTAYGYLTKVGQPLYERLLKAEEQADTQSRIVGGSTASLGQYPHQAGIMAIFGGGTGVCGGSLVNHRRVVTAAHCCFDGASQGTIFHIVLGSISLFTGGVRLTASSVTIHGSWNPNLIRNDIAIMNLPSNVNFNNNIRPVAMPSGSQLNETFASNTAHVSGFGLDRDGGSIDGILRHVQVTTITNDACNSTYPQIIQASNICISGANGRNTCLGDSGGPLTIQRNNTPLLIGVTSFGSARGCEIGAPTAFTRMTSFVTWVTQHL